MELDITSGSTNGRSGFINGDKGNLFYSFYPLWIVCHGFTDYGWQLLHCCPRATFFRFAQFLNALSRTQLQLCQLSQNPGSRLIQ